MSKQKYFVQEYIPFLKRKVFYRENYIIDINYKKYDEFVGGNLHDEEYNISLLSNVLYESINNSGIVTLILRKFLERNKYNLDIIKDYINYIQVTKSICCLYNFINNAELDNAELDNAELDNAELDSIDVEEFKEQKNIKELDNVLYVDNQNIKYIMSEEINHKYNIIYLIGVLHHVQNPDILLSKLIKCLDIDGTIIIKDIDVDNNIILAHQICKSTCLTSTKKDLIDIINKLNLYNIKIYDEDIIFTIKLKIK